MYAVTWRELSIVNIHANATVSLLTASNPNTQVMPSNGNKIMAVFSDALKFNDIFYRYVFHSIVAIHQAHVFIYGHKHWSNIQAAQLQKE